MRSLGIGFNLLHRRENQLEHLPDVALRFVLLQQHMGRCEVLRRLELVPPVDLAERGGREDEGVQHQPGGGFRQTGLDGFDLLRKGDLRVVETLCVPQAFGIDEAEILLLPDEEPDDEVGIEISSLEETDALLALVAEDEKLLSLEEPGVRFVVSERIGVGSRSS